MRTAACLPQLLRLLKAQRNELYSASGDRLITFFKLADARPLTYSKHEVKSES